MIELEFDEIFIWFLFLFFFLRFWLWAHVVDQLCFGWQGILIHSWCGWVHVLGICKYCKDFAIIMWL